MQQTLRHSITFQGTGLHSGADVLMVVKPAPADHGIIFIRTDVSEINNVIPARWDNVTDTRLCTVIGNEDKVFVGTIEHLMAALRGCGVDNAIIALDGPEVPIMDGSSEPFVDEIERAGLQEQDVPRRGIKILKSVTVEHEGKYVTLSPAEGSVFGGEIAFDHPSIGLQKREITLVNGNFSHDIAEARTFGFLHEVEALRKMGLAQGGSLDNAIVLDQERVINPDGLRFADEFIRHKLLDAIGDLYLAGGPIIGAYSASKPSHELNNKLLRALFANDDAWMPVDLYEAEGFASAHEDRFTALAAE